MRRPFTLSSIASLATLVLLAGCTPEAVTLKKIGEACTMGDECGKMLCNADKVCTRPCAVQSDCPSGFDCGLAHPVDGAMGGIGPTCYKSKNPFVMGGFGTDCGAYSPDPNNSSAVCDENATNPCAKDAGFTCLGDVKCDAAAYCTKQCTADTDCPPWMLCATDTLTIACKSDDDCTTAGYTCESTGAGKGKVCTGKRWCRKRSQCSPCATHDQCPSGFLCATDETGERFCGRLCTNDNQCPSPAPGISGYFYKCVDGHFQDGQNDGQMVCRPLQGELGTACHGKSVFETEPGGACAWCRDGIPSDCPDSYCFSLTSDEHFCAGLCKANSDCPDGMYCLSSGVCTADALRRSLTCFPE